MTKRFKKKSLFVKDKVINIFMKSGQKKTGEKILLKFVKEFQKSNSKHFVSLLQLAIMNSTPIFSVNTQVVKKGKKKSTKDVPSFLSNHSIRVNGSLDLLTKSVLKDKKSGNFYGMLVKEVLHSASLNSCSVIKKNDIQKQVLLNKRYLSNFKW